jgi:hypothetical protein
VTPDAAVHGGERATRIFKPSVDSGIEIYPHHFVDPDGAALWKIVSDFFRWEDADTVSERVNSIEEEVTV